MSATSRLKQLLFIVAALALVSLGLVAALSTASPARADDTQTCEESPEVNEGPTGFLTAPPDGRAWQIDETRTQPGTGTSDSTERINFTHPGGRDAGAPALNSPLWNPNNGEHNGTPHQQADNVVYQVGGGNGDWFVWKSVTTPGIPAVIEHTYTLHIPAVTCPPAPEECVPEDYNGEAEGCGTPPEECVPEDYNGEAEGCGTPPEECVPEDYNGQEPGCGQPPVDDGKKIVVCKYVGTPPGELDHIVIVSENTLNNVEDANGNPFAGVFPFEWTDAQGQTTEGSVAVRYAEEGEQANTLDLEAECGDGETPPEECVPEDYNGEAEGCGTPPEECVPEDYNGQEPGCGQPPVDDGKKIVVCKYVGTPPGELDHIVIVSENTLNNVEDANGNPFAGVFPFEWTDAQGQTTEGSVAVRYAEEGEQANELDLIEECGGEDDPEVCPDGPKAGQEIPEGETEEEFCDEVDPGPDTCPDGPKAGQEIPEGETEEEFCDEDDEDEVCPEDSDNAGQVILEGETADEVCDDDDVDPGPDCEEDPSQKKCDEDNPPVVVPGDGNSPSNGPTVRGASATAPTAVAGTTVVGGTPAAQVPTAVNAGLAPQELAGDGGTMGLLGIAAALLGAALVGLTFRPKRRIGAASHART